jgi:hypothetical protein
MGGYAGENGGNADRYWPYSPVYVISNALPNVVDIRLSLTRSAGNPRFDDWFDLLNHVGHSFYIPSPLQNNHCQR